MYRLISLILQVPCAKFNQSHKLHGKVFKKQMNFVFRTEFLASMCKWSVRDSSNVQYLGYGTVNLYHLPPSLPHFVAAVVGSHYAAEAGLYLLILPHHLLLLLGMRSAMPSREPYTHTWRALLFQDTTEVRQYTQSIPTTG